MQNFDFFSDDGDMSVEYCFRDYFFIMFVVAAALLAIVLTLVAEQKKDEETEDKAPGSVIVELVWDSERDVDLDLWVKAPGTDKPVGYSNKAGKVFNLLRDDLGHRDDLSGVNLENAYSRGTPGGEWIVNVHHFNDHDFLGEIEATVIVRVKSSPDSAAKPIVTTKLILQDGQEKTAIRFRLTSKGELVANSLGYLFKPLRSASEWTEP